MKKRKGTVDLEEKDRWLLTYADLLTLLLGFFVIMYSMSRIDAKRFGKMAEGLQGVFHGGESVFYHDSERPDLGSGVLKIGQLKLVQQRIKRLSNFVGKERVSLGAGTNITAETAAEGLADIFSDQITTEINERGLVIHILESALFESSKSELKPQALELLDLIALEIDKLPNHIRIEDTLMHVPIATFRYPSNWELSSARATTVVRYLIDKHGFPVDRVSALGYGEFRSLVANTSAVNRAKNRRVDIVVLTEELSKFEPGSAG